MSLALHLLLTVSWSLLCFMVVHLMLNHPRSLHARLLGLFLASGAAHLLLHQFREWQPGFLPFMIAFAMKSTQPFWFWLLALSYFQPSFRFKSRYWFILLAKVLVSLVTTLILVRNLPFFSPPQRIMIFLPAAVFSATLILLGMRQALREYRLETRQGRRRLRVLYALVGGLIALVSMMFRLGMITEEMREIRILVVACVWLAIGLALFFTGFRIHSDLVQEPAPIDVDERWQSIEERLLQTFDIEKVWRQEGLTIRQLASKMQAPEYVVRQIIRRMGFKNFNELLNRYRILEAAMILQDPAQRNLPVVRIAMDVGYRSLSSFNKAFKERMSATPTDFRKKHLAPASSEAETPAD